MPEQKKISLYFDENMPEAAAIQLADQGIDVMTTQEAKRCGADDLDQLYFAASLGRVICSHDKDFLELAKTDPVRCGIAFIGFKSKEMGALVRALRELHRNETAESMENRLVYL
ncbi:MAG: DUF5615 family PIN-like protein [Chloroflexi bacterium]|nr:DUF5615 family PIN-like protein [Chloroflexota bacterium]